MPVYHFDIGDSTKDVIGLCASVTAESREEAVKMLQEEVDAEVSDLIEIFKGGTKGIHYINVYLNSQNIKVEDIDEEEPE
jgi:hypothetical protein